MKKLTMLALFMLLPMVSVHADQDEYVSVTSPLGTFGISENAFQSSSRPPIFVKMVENGRLDVLIPMGESPTQQFLARASQNWIGETGNKAAMQQQIAKAKSQFKSSGQSGQIELVEFVNASVAEWMDSSGVSSAIHNSAAELGRDSENTTTAHARDSFCPPMCTTCELFISVCITGPKGRRCSYDCDSSGLACCHIGDLDRN